MTGKSWFPFAVLVFLVYATISLGAVTRATGAGMGCGPEWPLCLGHIVPPNLLRELEVFLEYSHRVTALLAFIAALLCFLQARTSSTPRGSGSLRLWTSITLLTVIAQVLLGAILVVFHLDPLVSALHTMLASLAAITATIAMVEARHYYS